MVAVVDRRGGSGERPQVMRTAASDDSLHANKSRSRPNADVRAAVACTVLCAPDVASQSPSSPGTSQQEAEYHEKSQQRRQSPFQQIDGQIGANFDGIQRNLLAPYDGTKPKGPAHSDRGSNGRSRLLEALPEGKPFQV